MTLLTGALALGCILSLLSLGVFVSFRICQAVDLTADGAFGLGAAVMAVLLLAGWPPLLASLGAVLAGAGAGVLTGAMHTRLGVSAVLSGVLTSTALYSVSLMVMGSGNLPLAGAGRAAPTLLLVLPIALGAALLLDLFLHTELGLALRASGRNPPMARAAAVHVDRMLVMGFAVANGLAGGAGALLAQYEGFANIQMGTGAFVTGLGGVLVGEALSDRRSLHRAIIAVVAGTLLFRLLISGAIRLGLHPSALKLVTAALVLMALTGSRWVRARNAAFHRA